MKKLLFNPKFEKLETEKTRLNEIFPTLKVQTPTCFGGFAPLRPLTEVRQRQKLIRRLSGEHFSTSEANPPCAVIKVRKLAVPRTRFASTFRKILKKSSKTSNTTQTESPDKENSEF